MDEELSGPWRCHRSWGLRRVRRRLFALTALLTLSSACERPEPDTQAAASPTARPTVAQRTPTPAPLTFATATAVPAPTASPLDTADTQRVQDHQIFLNLWDGFGLAEDGVFGPSAAEATAEFQRAHALVPTGTPDSLTVDTILDVLGRGTEPGLLSAFLDATGFEPPPIPEIVTLFFAPFRPKEITQ